MADLFPGTEMEVNEKYPDSRRLDHPNFEDVYKTTFAKGVITAFEVVSEDPVMVRSMVKVRIDGEESDYIPIFYHPKAGFWDGLGFNATAFNEAGKYFEKAWMSFRSGDEVIVMLKEGLPVAVVGFADGYPRVGENVFKCTWQKWNAEYHVCHVQGQGGPNNPIDNDFSEYGVMDDEEPEGPDGNKLGLLTEAILICDSPWESVVIPGRNDEFGTWIDCGSTEHYQYKEYLIRLGGRLFILQLGCHWSYNNICYAAGFWHEPYTDYLMISFSILGAPDSEDAVESAIENGRSHENYSPRSVWDGDYSTDPGYYEICAHPGFVAQIGAINGFMWHHSTFFQEMFSSHFEDVTNASTIKIYVRPHTKEELQEAGVWPE